MHFTRSLALFCCLGVLVVGASCAAQVDDGEAVESVQQGVGRPPTLCVDTLACGGCCGNPHQIDAFLDCCDGGGGLQCTARFGCR